jgi:pentapeptide MXKDX repeat protein
MKRSVLVAAMSAGLALTPAAFAQDAMKDGMKKSDTMGKSSSDKKMMDQKSGTMAKPAGTMDKKDGMSKEGMSKEGMSKDDMSKDGMKK